MAGIDHTSITYKDGKSYGKDIEVKGYKFCITRDSELRSIEIEREKRTVYARNEYNKKDKNIEFMEQYYGWHYWWEPRSKKLPLINKYIEIKEKKYGTIINFYLDEQIMVIGANFEKFNTVFVSGKDEKGEHFSFVEIGGYGHNCNPYTHFYNRGYGEDFEKKLEKECYKEFLMDDVAEEIFDILEHYKDDFPYDYEIEDFKLQFAHVGYFSRLWNQEGEASLAPYYNRTIRKKEEWGE